MTPISARGIHVMPTTLSGWPTTRYARQRPCGRCDDPLSPWGRPRRPTGSARGGGAAARRPRRARRAGRPRRTLGARGARRGLLRGRRRRRGRVRGRLLGRLRAVGALGRARPVARAGARGARVVPVETGALEGHADRRVDLAQPPAAVGALGPRGVTELLDRVEGVAARGARIRIRRHGGGLLRSWAAVGQAARKTTWGTRRDPNRFPTVRPTPRGGRPRRRRGSAARPCGARPPC